MAQRHSEYDRQPRDLYETPEWVTDVIVPELYGYDYIWEPACGSGKMSARLRYHGFEVSGTDIELQNADFLNRDWGLSPDAIVTNPPFKLAQKFIERSLELMDINDVGLTAMLLPINFDAAKGRRHLFGSCNKYRGKIVLTKRIVWFEPAIAQPSENHAWFIWRSVGAFTPWIKYYYE